MLVTVDLLHEHLLRNEVDYMSQHVFGVPYSELKSLLYPRPKYRAFVISKRSGAHRVIHEPYLAVKNLQYKALSFLEERAGSSKPCVHGFVSQRSILSNAKAHCNRQTQHLLNIDLEDFFPSISFYRVRGVFQKKPFDFSYEVATIFAHLCTYSGSLPQGAPTSPFVSNLICRSMDRDLMKLAKRHRARYTRYADDLTFSFSVRSPASLPSNICSFDTGLLSLGHELHETISSHGFQINDSKSRFSTRRQRLEVTGITINEFPNVKRNFIDQIRGALRAWEKFGYELAQKDWERRLREGTKSAYEKRPWKRQTRLARPPELRNVLWGKLLYLRMVRGGDDVLYTKLAERFNSLCDAARLAGIFIQARLPVEPIVRNAVDAEKAVFVVEWFGDFQPGVGAASEMVGNQGTAFAYKKFGLVTCDHIFRYLGQGEEGEFEVDFDSVDLSNKELWVRCPSTGQEWQAVVVHRDAGRDLALLKLSSGETPDRHFSSADSPIHRNAQGALIGFPNWSPGRTANLAAASVLSRYPRSGLQRFEISTGIRQGNSGGPYVDELYRVSGVAQQGAKQDGGNDECLCYSELDHWLSLVMA